MVDRVHSRRAFLIGAGAIAVGAGLDAFALEPNWLDVTRHDVPVDGLPQRLDGFTIAQISDAHLKRLGTVEETIARVLQSESLQLIVLTGDMVDSALSLDVLQEFGAALRKSGTTVVAALGNWEHWGSVPLTELAKVYARTGARLLVNEAAVLPDGIRVYATDDSTGGTPKVGPLYDDGRALTVLTTHSPALLDTAFSPNAFSLALSGHTHGGQMRLGPNGIPFRPFGCGRFVGGWYDTRGGRAYVSRGTGTSILPARFTCRPELPILRLRRA
jgi:predicted MPP superfamily phosphohydrolase